MEQIEPVEKKICRACEKEKKITSFAKGASGKRGGVCNLCKSLGMTIKNKTRIKKPPIKNNPLQLGNVSKKDYITAYQFLEKAGYSLKEDLHEQFCKKYNLPIREPKRIFNNHYSQEDCGLI
jgi:hypothetical protein